MLTQLKYNFNYKTYPSSNKSDFATQTTNDLSCYLCNYQWDTVYDLYSHIVTQCHKSARFITCLRCKFKLNYQSLDEHDCLKNKSTFLKHLGTNSIRFGLPFICLLCQGRKFRSKAVLFVHLICYHSPNLNNSDKCGNCPYRIKRKKTNKKLEQFHLPQYNYEFDNHIEKRHVFGYDLSFIHQLNLESERRHPYACIACSSILSGNDQFHAHVICQHASKYEYNKGTCVCLVCNIPYWSADKFSEHVNNTHTAQYRQLAIQLSKFGSLTNNIDLQTTCIYCWSHFENRMHLHAHIIMQHAYFSMSIQCGLCDMDFKINKELSVTYDLFNRHNDAHFNEFELNSKTKVNIFSTPKLSTITSKTTVNSKNKKIKNL